MYRYSAHISLPFHKGPLLLLEVAVFDLEMISHSARAL